MIIINRTESNQTTMVTMKSLHERRWEDKMEDEKEEDDDEEEGRWRRCQRNRVGQKVDWRRHSSAVATTKTRQNCQVCNKQRMRHLFVAI